MEPNLHQLFTEIRPFIIPVSTILGTLYGATAALIKNRNSRRDIDPNYHNITGEPAAVEDMGWLITLSGREGNEEVNLRAVINDPTAPEVERQAARSVLSRLNREFKYRNPFKDAAITGAVGLLAGVTVNYGPQLYNFFTHR